MKSKILYSHTLINKAIKEETKKHPFCFVCMYPSEECIISEVLDIANLSGTLKDDEIVIIPAKDLKEMKAIWEKIVKHNVAYKFEAFKKGKQITF